mgnify:CR=1 FL=1
MPTSSYPVVCDNGMLKRMEKQGFIKRSPDSEIKAKHWTGRMVPVYYVEDAGPKLDNWYDVFTFSGAAYRLKYFEGCFKPFVVRADAKPSELPAFA